jgi:hypothetical protein
MENEHLVTNEELHVLAFLYFGAPKLGKGQGILDDDTGEILDLNIEKTKRLLDEYNIVDFDINEGCCIYGETS